MKIAVITLVILIVGFIMVKWMMAERRKPQSNQKGGGVLPTENKGNEQQYE